MLRGQRSDVFRVRESSLDLHLEWLDAQWAAGQRNSTELWRQLKKQEFRGCLRVATEWASRRRQAERAGGALSRTPSSRTITRLMTIGCNGLSKAETVIVAMIENGVPLLVEAREIVAAAKPNLFWSNGQTEGADHEAQACEAPDVWSRKAQPSPSPGHWAGLAQTYTKSASEPKLTPRR